MISPRVYAQKKNIIQSGKEPARPPKDIKETASMRFQKFIPSSYQDSKSAPHADYKNKNPLSLEAGSALQSKKVNKIMEKKAQKQKQPAIFSILAEALKSNTNQAERSKSQRDKLYFIQKVVIERALEQNKTQTLNKANLKQNGSQILDETIKNSQLSPKKDETTCNIQKLMKQMKKKVVQLDDILTSLLSQISGRVSSTRTSAEQQKKKITEYLSEKFENLISKITEEKSFHQSIFSLGAQNVLEFPSKGQNIVKLNSTIEVPQAQNFSENFQYENLITEPFQNKYPRETQIDSEELGLKKSLDICNRRMQVKKTNSLQQPWGDYSQILNNEHTTKSVVNWSKESRKARRDLSKSIDEKMKGFDSAMKKVKSIISP